MTRLPPGRSNRVGRFELIERIGTGAMGVVYRAHDPVLRRDVALKLMPPGEEATRRRVLREARAMAHVAHPNLVPIYDLGSERDGSMYIAMELIEGPTVRQWMQDRPWRDVVCVFAAIAAALRSLHESGLVHRDVKPDNVMLDSEGRVRVMDLGISSPLAKAEAEDTLAEATASQTRARAGTIAYMAPELFEGRRAKPASDQFAFFVSLFEGLTGERPFESQTPWAHWMDAADPSPVEFPRSRVVPHDLQRAIRRGLSPKPGQRFRSMREVELELRAALRSARRRPWMAALAASAFATCMSFLPTPAAMEDVAESAEVTISAPSDTVQTVVRALDEAETRAEAGELDTARLIAKVAVSLARDSLDTEFESKTRLAVARLVDAYDHEAGQAALADAAWFALSEGRTWQAATASLALARDAGQNHVDLEEARVWLGRADAALEEIGDPRLRAESEATAAIMAWRGGEYEVAELRMRRAEVIRRILDPEDPEVAQTQSAIATMLQEQGRFSEAYDLHAEAVRTLKSIHGPWHPDLAVPLYGMASSAAYLGRLEEAELLARTVHTLEEAFGGEDYPARAANLGLIADTLLRRGATDAAAPLLEEALQRARARYGHDHPLVASLLATRADTQPPEQALSSLREAERIFRGLHPEHPTADEIASAIENLEQRRHLAG